MFDQLFFRSDALTRQLSAPLVDERRLYHSTHNGDPSSSRRRGHQYNPRLAGACLAEHHKCLRGSGPGNES